MFQLLTHVGIKKKRPLLIIDGKGEIFLDYNHLFPTKRLSQNKRVNLLRNLDNSLEKIISNQVIQVSAPISQATTLPPEFIRGNYIKQLRWRTSNANTAIQLSTPLQELLTKQQEINSLVDLIRTENQQNLAGRAKSYVTRCFNQQISTLQSQLNSNQLPETETPRRIAQLYHSLPGSSGFSFELKKTGLEVVLSDFNHIQFENQLSLSNMKQQKWLLLDIEKPLYGDPDEEISWVTMCYLDLDSRVYQREVHTLRETSNGFYLNYNIYHYSSEAKLLEGIICSVDQQNPAVISAYNAPYDLRSIQSAIRENKTPQERFFPKIEVAKKFFERMKIDRRQVFDLMRYAKTAFHFLPDHKLETVSRHVLGMDHFKKSIGYDEMRHLERLSKEQGNLEAADKICHYAIEDVEVMVDLIQNLHIPQSLNSLCNHFFVELGRTVHNPDSVNDLRERKYFAAVGTFMPQPEKAVPKLKKRKEKLVQQAHQFKKDLISEGINYQPKRGFHEGVSLGYIPWADYLRSALNKRFELDSFFQEKYRHFDNSEIQFFMSQYLDKFIESAFTSFLSWQNTQQDFSTSLSPFTVQETEQMVEELFSDLHQFSRWGVYNVQKGRMQQETFDNYISNITQSRLASRLLDGTNLYAAAQKYAQLQAKEKAFAGLHGLQVQEFAELIQSKADNLTHFLSSHNLEVPFQDGTYLFVKGPKQGREPFFRVVHSLDLLLTANLTPIYKLAGKYAHVKLKSKPLNYQTLFETDLLRDFLALVFNQQFSTAKELVEDRKQQLKSHHVPPQQLMYWTRSHNIHSGFENHNEKPTYFYLNHIPSENSLFDGTHHYESLTEPLETTSSQNENLTMFNLPTTQQQEKHLAEIKDKVYYYTPTDFNPNFDLYYHKIFGEKSKIHNMLLVLPDQHQMELFTAKRL